MKQTTNYTFLFIISLLILSCGTKVKQSQLSTKVLSVNIANFISNQEGLNIEIVDCELSTGIKSKCLQIITNSAPTDHIQGPWCPESIFDSDSDGGIWFKDGEILNVDGEFIKNLSTLYEDENWRMYDETGKVYRTNSREDCEKLAGARLLDEYTNYCIECLPSYITDFNKTVIIPLNPVLLQSPTLLHNPQKGKPNGRSKNREDSDKKGPPKGPPPGGRGGPSSRGIAFNGVIFDAPAPVSLILSGYTIPPLDPAGGHINMDAGYHYHAATGLTKEIAQNDGHAPMIGYALDGIALYAYQNEDGTIPNDLDQCRGHYDEVRGYHYHVDATGSNNFINCFSAALATKK